MVILLMFFAVIVMVNNVDNGHEERATLAPHSNKAMLILVSGTCTGFLILALLLRLFHRCIQPEFAV